MALLGALLGIIFGCFDMTSEAAGISQCSGWRGYLAAAQNLVALAGIASDDRNLFDAVFEQGVAAFCRCDDHAAVVAGLISEGIPH
jgi:hypothetical protein